ncbi:thioredoxin-like protein [Escherichia coli]|nr:thioredoxin-like protein [Escherichia coli]
MLRAFARLLLRICFSRRTLKIACLLLLVAGATILIADRVMVNASKQLTWSDVNAVPARNVGLLLGARPGNRYFTRRIDTAAALYHAGKVKWLLVSGDNGRKNYDEASGMQQALIAKGVPAKVIFCDYAGFSTLDSVVRAKKVLVKTISPLSRKNFIINAPSGWQNSTASTLSVLTRQTSI